jgi:dihydrofolate reductase
MSIVFASIGMSLDGYIAGPNAGPGNALGDGGHRIHEWVLDLDGCEEDQGRGDGEDNADGEVVQEIRRRAGAYVMGRWMFDEGDSRRPDPPPFRAPVFVLTHHAREAWTHRRGAPFTFVTAGVTTAVEQAREAARDKDVQVVGGATTVQQCLEAGVLDELQIHLAPVLLGSGVRLFDRITAGSQRFDTTRVIDSRGVTHLRYRVSAA